MISPTFIHHHLCNINIIRLAEIYSMLKMVDFVPVLKRFNVHYLIVLPVGLMC